MEYTQEIKRFVKEECEKENAKYGSEPFDYHLVPMLKYALDLADELGGNKEVVELAVWLHDIGSFRYGRKDHYITGAEIAEAKLRELGYPDDKIELVGQCILNHRGSVANHRKTIEEKIVAEADTMSNFDNIAGIFKAAFVYEGLDQGSAKQAVLDKLERKWQRLSFKKSKNILRPKYEAAKILLF